MISTHVRTHLRKTILLLLLVPIGLKAQFTTPHIIDSKTPVTNSLNYTKFINQGLVGVGHISSSMLDIFGESFGSASGLAVTGWKNLGDGSYTGTLNILPDRGYNSGGFYADYAARINQINFQLRPYYGTASIGGTTELEKLSAQTNQLTFGAVEGVKFTYSDPYTGSNSFTTGLDPGTNHAELFNQTMPYVRTFRGVQSPSVTNLTTYTDISKLPLDSEALVLKADGSGYIGDEYGAHIYYFNPSKQIVDVIVPPAAWRPESPREVLNFNSTSAPLAGRRNNQGLEGVSLSPDGTRLFALLQSACVQDANQAANDHKAKNTRLLIYDVSSDPTPAEPMAEYVLTLPTYTANGRGGAVNRTCAQSEILALDQFRFLILPRDGNGLGNSVTNPNVYKTVLLADVSAGQPTDIAKDAARNASGGIITSNGVAGVLDPSLTPVPWVEAVNLLNIAQLEKFNVAIDTGTNQVTKLHMGEKWEGMAITSAEDPANPDDYFLFISNDNDFLTSDGRMRGPDGTIITYNGFSTNGATPYSSTRIPAPLDSLNSENDTRILVYRVTISTELHAVVRADSEGHISVTVVGGTIGQPYSILSSIDLTTPSSWSAETTLLQTASGATWVDNAAPLASKQKFYRVSTP